MPNRYTVDQAGRLYDSLAERKKREAEEAGNDRDMLPPYRQESADRVMDLARAYDARHPGGYYPGSDPASVRLSNRMARHTQDELMQGEVQRGPQPVTERDFEAMRELFMRPGEEDTQPVLKSIAQRAEREAKAPPRKEAGGKTLTRAERLMMERKR